MARFLDTKNRPLRTYSSLAALTLVFILFPIFASNYGNSWVRIMAFALLHILPGFVILAALGSNIYWVTLVVKLRELLRDEAEETVAA